MQQPDLETIYRRYIDCLNRRDFEQLDAFVGHRVAHNGRTLGLGGYRKMLQDDVEAIPDLKFNIELLAVDELLLASRLVFDCHPAGTLFGHAINGRRVQFSENVFYAFENERIQSVWSNIDTTTIASQIGRQGSTHS